MLLSIIIFYLAVSLVFYVLFGGADFGAGILDMITRKSYRSHIGDAIGPVWEANHIWLILVVVILFMGFPRIYAVLSLYLHIPILLLLIGIILRGTAFTYMHYDAIQDRSVIFYDWIFKVSSVLAPMFLGVIVGASMLGRINPDAASFFEAFIAPWFNGFSFAVGLFTICLFTFLAAVFMIGETDNKSLRQAFVSIVKRIQVAMVLSGLLIFIAGYFYDFPLFSMFFNSVPALLCVLFATVSLPALWYFLERSKSLIPRFIAGVQIVFIMSGWFLIQFPDIIRIQGSEDNLSLVNTAAPDSTLLQLSIALIVGSCIILPSLYYLMKTFKGEQFRNSSSNQTTN
ncbi:MAG: cytochrome d ubiquinol oxidase subunit II [Balneolales bacterium]